MKLRHRDQSQAPVESSSSPIRLSSSPPGPEGERLEGGTKSDPIVIDSSPGSSPIKSTTSNLTRKDHPSTLRATQLASRRDPAPILPRIPQPALTRDPAFEAYVARSRRKSMTDVSPKDFEDWSSWSWSRLKEPVWVVASYPRGSANASVSRTTLVLLAAWQIAWIFGWRW